MDSRRILWPRAVSSVFWTILLQAFPLGLYIAIINADILHPLKWLQCVVSNVFHIANWVYLLPVYGVLCSLGVLYTKDYATRPPVCLTRFRLILSLFTTRTACKGLCYLLLGTFIPFLYLRINENYVSTACDTPRNEKCIQERTVFIICCGMWAGLYCFIQDALAEKSFQFPVIQQVKFLQVRHYIFSLVPQAFSASVYPVLYYIVLYYCNGDRVCSLFQAILKTRAMDSSLTSLSGIFNISLFAHSLLMTTIIILTINILKKLFEIHMTEHYLFVVNEPQPLMHLPVAMGYEQVPIVQKLAFYDLYIISSSMQGLRGHMFTLSQPGGHPHLWNAVVHECFKTINSFILEVEDMLTVPQPAKRPDPVPRHVHTHVVPAELSPLHTTGGKLRSLMDPCEPLYLMDPPPPSFLDLLLDKLAAAMPISYVQPAINYCFGTLPDAKIRHVLSNSECVTWAALSLSELSAHALKEDKFGIALKDLPAVISLLLHLKSNLEKVSKLGSVKKFQKKENYVYRRHAMQSAVKRSLYKIALAYAEYLTDLPLSPEMQQSMFSFVMLKEC